MTRVLFFDMARPDRFPDMLRTKQYKRLASIGTHIASTISKLQFSTVTLMAPA